MPSAQCKTDVMLSIDPSTDVHPRRADRTSTLSCLILGRDLAVRSEDLCQLFKLLTITASRGAILTEGSSCLPDGCICGGEVPDVDEGTRCIETAIVRGYGGVDGERNRLGI